MTEPRGNSPLRAPEDVLLAMAALLGVNLLKEENSFLLHSNCNLDWSSIPWEPSGSATDSDQEGPGVDFSSFPSLSLDRSHGEQFESPRGGKSDVEAHVSALLSRPILVSSATDVPMPEDDDGETLDFVAAKVAEVPASMVQNFFNSFTTLMNSRLRAYATFLARHGLTLLETSSTSSSELEEGVAGVEQKLETMLEIGRLESTNAIVTSFHANKDEVTRNETSDGTVEVSMPLVMNAAIDIALAGPRGHQSEIVTVAFQTTGKITGVFSNASDKCLLRAVEVDLDMAKLLECMIEQAASVISCIVEMTNATFSLSLPSSLDEAQGVANACVPSQDGTSGKKRKERAHLVEPDTPLLLPTEEADKDYISELSLNKETGDCLDCEHLVDFVLNETPESMLSPPSSKRVKLMSVEGAEALPTIS